MTDRQRGSTATLSWSARRFLLLLGFPAFGLAFTVTLTSSYVPVLVERVSNPVVIGALIGGEGFFALFVPVWAGALADRGGLVRRRLVVMVASAAVLAASTAAVGLLGDVDGSLWAFVVALVGLYVGYYAFLAPYWALYPDLVPDEQSGRSRSAESTWRVAGVGLALVGGGVLLGVSPGLPFLLAALLVVVVTAVVVLGLRSRAATRIGSGDSSTTIRLLLADRDIAALAVANTLWNFALAALRGFVVLYFTIGLERSTTFVATVIFPLVAVGIGVAAPLSGWLADRWGHVRVLTVALVVYGVLMAVPAFVHASWVIALIPPVAMGAATVMTLPLSVLMRLLPPERHGAASGLFGLSRGVGGTLGPLVAGVAIVATGGSVFDDTEGYAAMWLVCSIALVASIPLLRSLRHDDRL